MSMATILGSLKPGKAVHEFKSLWIDGDSPRTMVVSADVFAATLLPFPDTPEGARRGELRAWLESFVELAELTVSENPFDKPSDTMLARVAPVEAEFWAIRVTEPEDTPGIRAFGGFADRDEFIAVTWELREVIDDDFPGAVEDARETWSDHFAEPPFRGDSLDEYLTNYRPV